MRVGINWKYGSTAILIVYLPSARMRSDGTVVGFVCLSVTLHLTSRVFVGLTKDTTYLTGNEGQKY